jgi:hypothetical protein
MRPVGGISWRDAARYCNWLHNGKSSSLASLTTGAYDTTTFGGNRTIGYTDAATRLPGAKYWIPSLDEWMKAAWYDPDRFGNGAGGWWDFTNRSNQNGAPGLPGVGSTSAGLQLPNRGEWTIALGAYSAFTSPWGLLDTSGGAAEWIEEWAGKVDRATLGAAAGDILQRESVSTSEGLVFDPEEATTIIGLRIAAAIPNGSTLGVLMMFVFTVRRRR